MEQQPDRRVWELPSTHLFMPWNCTLVCARKCTTACAGAALRIPPLLCIQCGLCTRALSPPLAPNALQNKMKINDWLSIQSLFDELNRRLDKYQKYQGMAAPRIYIRMLVELDDFLNDTMANKDIKKKMSSTNAKALNAMRQRLKKHIPLFTELVEKYKENPESTDEEEEEEEEGKEEVRADDEDKKQVG